MPRTSTGPCHGQTATVPQTWRVASQYDEMISPKAWSLVLFYIAEVALPCGSCGNYIPSDKVL